MRLRSIYFALTALICGGMAAMIAGAAPPSQEKQVGKEKAAREGWKLVWADEFDYTGLPDPAKWDYEVGYVRNNEAQYYTRARKENAWVEGGVLTITGRKEKFPIPTGRGSKGKKEANYTAASLITRGKAAWTFGLIEMRAKLPKGRGAWPAFWTLGTAGGWPRDGEIDIMEYVGKEPHDIHSNLHYSIGGRHTSSGGSVKLDNPWDTFHVYAMEWNSRADGLLLRPDQVLHVQSLQGRRRGDQPLSQAAVSPPQSGHGRRLRRTDRREQSAAEVRDRLRPRLPAG